MFLSAGSYAAYAGVALHAAHGSRGRAAAGSKKSERTEGRNGYCSGYQLRRLDMRMGTMYLMVPKVRQGGYITFFATKRKCSEAALIQVVQEAFVQCIYSKNGKAGQEPGNGKSVPEPGQRDDKGTE